ncbi:MAG: GIY-YIG nuclease family protein [Deltaproteobacteria bacterium]|nr:GIY-YIG nuclease family protein [Deltaproteobacteria bacterium]
MGDWCVYILRCRDGSLYTGCTNDLPRRLATHNAGKGAAYTRSRRPVTVAFTEAAADRGAALRREAALKRLSRAEKLALLPRPRPSPQRAAETRATPAAPPPAPRRKRRSTRASAGTGTARPGRRPSRGSSPRRKR